jgi:hypothetical protein
MKKIATFCLLVMFSLVNAQTITFNGCHTLFDNQNYIFNQTGTDGTGRNMYTTTPVDGQACGGLGTCEFKIQWNNTSSRWEFLADEGNGTFAAPLLIYSNTSASTPKPPSLLLGSWIENNAITLASCGGTLTSGNSILTGDIQDTTLSNNEFSINKGIVVYPNPTSNFLTIISSSAITEITVWNVQGQKVLGFDNVTSIDVSGLQAGMYITRIQTENGLQISNFIKK